MTTIRNESNVLLQSDVYGTNDIDLSKDAGQNGFEADIRVLANSSPHVQNPARIVVTRTPGWMDRHPNAEVIKANFIYLVETHPESWSGLEIGSSIGTGERQVGWDGQVTKAPTTRTVNQIQPQATYKAIGEGVDINYWNYYIDVAIVAAGKQSPDFGELSSVPDAWTLVDYTFDMLVWEPNSTFTRARWAMAIGGLWPSTPVTIALERTLTEARKMREYTMTFEGGVYDDSRNTLAQASALEAALNVNRIKNSTKPAFFAAYNDIDVSVSEGLLKQIQNYGS